MEARYTVPPLKVLFDRVPNVRKKYQGNNPARIKLLDLFEQLMDTLKNINRDEILLDDKMYHELCFAGWRLFPIMIEVKKGRFSSLGSLHAIFEKELEIEHLNNIDIFDQLKQLSLIYNFVKANEKEFTVPFTFINTSVKEFLNQTLEAMRFLTQGFSQKINTLLAAIPCEKALDKAMQALPDIYDKGVKEQQQNAYIKYFHSGHDPMHTFLASLTRAISLVVPPDEDHPDDPFISRSMRIKTGAVLFNMLFVKPKYKVRDPIIFKASILCYESYKMLNNNGYAEIPLSLQADCIAAFSNFLDDNNNIKKLEETIDNGYIDLSICRIKKECLNILSTLGAPNVSTSSVTLGAAAVGAVLGAIPFYGVGYTIGYIASETNNTINTKIEISKLTGRMMTVMYGNKGQCLSYFVSDVFVNIALERSFAKVFELFGMLLGASCGAGVGIIVYDFSYRTLVDLCSCYFRLESSIKPNLAKDINSNIIECLLMLPEDVFDATHKKQLCTITDHTLFIKKVKKEEDDKEVVLVNDKDNDNDADNIVNISGGESDSDSEDKLIKPSM